MSIRASWTLATIALTILTQAYAPALASTCAVQTAPTMGWRHDGGYNIILPSPLTRATSQEIVDMSEQELWRSWLSQSSVQNIAIQKISDTNTAGWRDVVWEVTGTVQGDEGPIPYEGSTAEVQAIEDYACPSGYALDYPSGSPICVLNDINLRSCVTDATPAKNRECPKQPAGMEGNPCNVGTGNKYQVEVDYEGHPDSHLTYSRYYNSDATTPLSSHAKQWRGTYDRVLAFETDPIVGASYNGPPALFAYRHGGNVITFIRGTSITPKDSSTVERVTQINNVTWELTNADGEVETYTLTSSTRASLTSIRFTDGRRISLTYNGSGQLATVADEFGHKLTFTFNSAGRITKFTDPANKSFTYTYNTTTALLTKITFPDTTFKQYTYGTGVNATSLTGIIDEGAVTYASWTYDSSKRATSSQHAGGANATTIAYNLDGSRTVTKAYGGSRTYQFDLIQNELKFANRLEGGHDEDVSYDANGFVASRIDRNGIETTYVHDARGLETSRTEAAGTPAARTITTQWHATRRVPTLITEANRTAAFTYNSLGNMLTKTVTDTLTAQSRTWTYTYDAYGRVLTENGARTDLNDTTTVAYYTCTTGGRCGRPQTITNALGHVTTYNTYDANGRPLTVTDPNGIVTTRVYDFRGRLTSQTVGISQTTIEYWPTGLVKKITLPDATYTMFTYDGAHRLTEISDSEGNRRVYTLDAAGSRTAEQLYDPSSTLTQSMTRVFDTLNRLWKEVGAAGTNSVTTEFGYDDSGNRTSIDAPSGRFTQHSYDELNRVNQVSDPLSGVTTLEYNALGQLTAVSDPRYLTTSYTHNALGDLLETISPDTGTTTRTYNANGNLLTQTDSRGKTGTYTYDALNRPITLTYPDQGIGFAYDTGTNQKGRLKQITDASGSTSWNYDTRGRVLSRQQSMGVSKTVSYTYDTSSRIATMTLPSGAVISYTYTQGKTTTVKLNSSTTLVSGVLYQPFGATRGWTWGNSTLAVREYNLDGQVTDIDSAGLKSYAYDDAFRVTSITDAGNAALNQTFGYDLLDRVTSATGPAGTQGWSYDANDNRLSQTGAQPSTYTLAGGSNRLSSVSGSLSRSYSYDAAGNVTGNGASTFAYNDVGRMVSATTSGVTTTYTYNALGQRVKKTSGGSARYFVYDDAGHLVGEYSNSGALLQEIVWLNNTPIAVLLPNGAGVSVFYIHTDHLNTPRRITRPADNVVVWRWDGDSFGAVAADDDPDADSVTFGFNLRFPGQYRDAESGLLYNVLRTYDPSTGRYMESDPLGLAGGVNTYSYVNGNPLSFSDPLGLLPVCDTQIKSTDYRTWNETSHRGIKIPSIEMHPILKIDVGPEVSLRPTKDLPIGAEIDYAVWFVWLHFRRDMVTSYEQFVHHMVSFCTDTINGKCGAEETITLDPAYFDKVNDPVKLGVTESDFYLYSELVRKLGET